MSQSEPIPNDSPSIHDLVLRDLAREQYRSACIGDPQKSLETLYHNQILLAMDFIAVMGKLEGQKADPNQSLMNLIQQRKEIGLATYGTCLQANNGRNAFQDAIEEMADAICYLMQMIEELK